MWDPIPDPPGLDPATLQQFQVLAAEHAQSLDHGDQAVGSALASTAEASAQAEGAMDSLALDFAGAASGVAGQVRASEADTLSAELTQAAEQDAALGQVVTEVAPAWPEQG